MGKAGGAWFFIFYIVGMVVFANVSMYSRCDISFWDGWWHRMIWPAIVAEQSAVVYYGIGEKLSVYECEEIND